MAPSENANYYLIASHSSINRNVKRKIMPPNTWYLPLAKCFLPGKTSHNKEYSTFFNRMNLVKRFVRNHPAGFFGPGDPYQDVTISAQPTVSRMRNKLVHGVIKLPIPTGSNLSNKNKLNERKSLYKYQLQNLSVANRKKYGQVRLSQVFNRRPGVYIGDFCRVANGILYYPKTGKTVLGSGTNVRMVNINRNMNAFIRHHSKRYNLSHAEEALNIERVRGPPVKKSNIRKHINSLKERSRPPTVVPKTSTGNTNYNALFALSNNENGDIRAPKRKKSQ
jgi:hypothetical protein